MFLSWTFVSDKARGGKIVSESVNLVKGSILACICPACQPGKYVLYAWRVGVEHGMILLNRITFGIWYYFKPPWDSGISPPELISFIESHVPGRALDLGCGTGTNCITLARHGWSVTGIDFAPRAIRLARKKTALSGLKISYYREDVTKTRSLSPPYDLILDIGCFHGLDEDSRSIYLDNLNHLLASTGAFLLYAIVREGAERSHPGIFIQELDALSSTFDLISRQDGLNFGTRPSVWMEYRKR
jgi:SAM-dependent methyltransferase